jgi:hypothetical protein
MKIDCAPTWPLGLFLASLLLMVRPSSEAFVQPHHVQKVGSKTTSTRGAMVDTLPVDFSALVGSYEVKWGVPLAALALGYLATRPPAQLVSDSQLRSLVEGTYLEKADLVRAYKASKDGWSAINFHEAVDGKGSAVVVARTSSGQVFGGYNPNGWRSTDDYYLSSAAFLYYLLGNKRITFPVLAGGNAAVFDYATAGPCFGAADLLIGPPLAAVMGGFAGPDMEDTSKGAGDLRQCKSSVGGTYDASTGYRGWPVKGGAQLVEVEVYCRS